MNDSRDSEMSFTEINGWMWLYYSMTCVHIEVRGHSVLGFLWDFASIFSFSVMSASAWHHISCVMVIFEPAPHPHLPHLCFTSSAVRFGSSVSVETSDFSLSSVSAFTMTTIGCFNIYLAAYLTDTWWYNRSNWVSSESLNSDVRTVLPHLRCI